MAMLQLMAELDKNFDLFQAKARCIWIHRSWQLALNHQKRKRLAAEVRLAKTLAERVSGRISHLWFIRAGFSDPSTPATTLAQYCREWPVDETGNISKTTISTLRDTFSLVVIDLRFAELRNMAVAATRIDVSEGDSGNVVENSPLFLIHGHDEASLRTRSYDPNVVEGLVRHTPRGQRLQCVPDGQRLIRGPFQQSSMSRRFGSTGRCAGGGALGASSATLKKRRLYSIYYHQSSAASA